MTSERIARRIERFLDQAEEAADVQDWTTVAGAARAVLAIDDAHQDARAYLRMAVANLETRAPPPEAGRPAASSVSTAQPASFVGGRYEVRRFLGEGGKKKVYLAHDRVLDRDVAFALIKTEGLDDTGRERVTREAQAMGRMGAHPHIVSVFDLGEESGAPYIVSELMQGGDVEGELERAGGPLDLGRALEVAKGVVRGLVYAHERGIVHRDLKPGNVWLTAEGVAKIGDFGLAVAEGRSRLTQHGMMVGTFAYMPPEQALGSEVTPRSDLYSLGAMLYELVTGKPPFEADDPTAVISQHLNAEPVAPSWRTKRCPPALEDLILALLAKDPSTRPASAAEVLGALEAVDPDSPSRSHSSDSTNPLDRLARGVFVGRERELARLRGALDDALAGRGSVVMLVGEPGIGKTRTVAELETYARLRGAKVLWGRAHESSGAPPYWPWVQVARAYREDTPDEVRRAQYEPYATELQRIFPGLRDLFPGLPEPATETEEGQFRLFDAFSAFARSVAVETPLVFVLDDLHWADGATLGLLTHLARELGRARILVVGTYRDTDLDRRHPLATALAELGREDLFSRISLRGLSLTETEEYLRQAASVEPARELVARIFEETEGNPFFLSEVVNLMTEEGSFAKDSVSDIAVPEGVRQALGRRLDRLSEEANELLTVLAVAGRDFEHALVQSLSAHDDATTLHLLEQALGARVLEEVGAGRYRFTHALMQETLLGELSAARRVLLHGKIAEAMEAYYGAERDYLAMIAQHYFESASLNTVHKRQAARYSRLAAEAAASALAPSEAAQLYRRCLDLVSGADDELGENEAELWSDLAVCLSTTAAGVSAWVALERALALDSAPLSRARRLVRFRGVGAPMAWLDHRALVERGIEDLNEQPSLEACSLLALLSVLDLGPIGDRAYARAEEMASGLQLDRSALPPDFRARPIQILFQNGAYAQAADMARDLLAEVRAGGQSPNYLFALLHAAVAAVGDIREYERTLTALEEVSKRTHNFVEFFMSARATLEWRRGHRAAARELLAGTAGESALIQVTVAEFDLEEGRLEEALHACAGATEGRFTDTGGTHVRALGLLARVQHLLGNNGDAALALDHWSERLYGVASTTGALFHVAVPSVSDTLCELGNSKLVDDVSGMLAARPTLKYWSMGELPDYMRGAISLRLDRIADAEQHFRAGLDYTSQPDVHFEVDEGRCCQGLAEVAERRGDHALAMQHLDAAGELFAKHGAKLYLDQVLAKKEILKA